MWHFLAGLLLGVLLTLRMTVAVVQRVRQTTRVESYRLGFNDGLQQGSSDFPRSGADEPASIDGGGSHGR